MIVLGLTGGIATGKTTVAQQLVELGAAHFDADAAVHRLMQDAETIAEIAELAPEAVQDGVVDRRQLGAIVFANEAKLKQLETLLHPRVREEELEWLEKQEKAGASLVVLDIPLLFESGADALCDYVLVADCPPDLQHQRAMKRPGMTSAKLAQILARQMEREERIARADAVIDTGSGMEASREQLRAFLAKVMV